MPQDGSPRAQKSLRVLSGTAGPPHQTEWKTVGPHVNNSRLNPNLRLTLRPFSKSGLCLWETLEKPRTTVPVVKNPSRLELLNAAGKVGRSITFPEIVTENRIWRFMTKVAAVSAKMHYHVNQKTESMLIFKMALSQIVKRSIRQKEFTHRVLMTEFGARSGSFEGCERPPLSRNCWNQGTALSECQFRSSASRANGNGFTPQEGAHDRANGPVRRWAHALRAGDKSGACPGDGCEWSE
jgi:hypothetical protein